MTIQDSLKETFIGELQANREYPPHREGLAKVKNTVKLAIIYGTGFGNTGIIAKAIEERARNIGIEVTIKKGEGLEVCKELGKLIAKKLKNEIE